jgi:preprotein translocase subunit SecG
MSSAPVHRFGLGAAAVTASLAVAGALLVGPADGQAVGARSSGAEHSQVTTARGLALHDHMRKLWEDHVAWTRMAIVTFADGSAGFGATARRLLRNQEDIGTTFGRFYGTTRGDRLASLLHDHITIAVELLQAAKAGDQAAVADASDRWYANARAIADFLSRLNPHAWPRHEMRSMMKTHLDQTLAEAVDELTGHFHRGVREYGAIERHILEMADTLSSGIESQFPRRFAR